MPDATAAAAALLLQYMSRCLSSKSKTIRISRIGDWKKNTIIADWMNISSIYMKTQNEKEKK